MAEKSKSAPFRKFVLVSWRILKKARPFALLFLAFLLVVRVVDPTPVQVLRVRSFDLLQMLNENADRQPVVMVVDIDEKSLKNIGQWPWPRNILGKLVDKIRSSGAAAVGFDVIFAEPDRTSPDAFAANTERLTPQIRDYLKSLPSNDELFARAIAKYRVVLGSALINVANEHPNRIKGKATYAILGVDPRPFAVSAPGRTLNLPILEKAASGVGMITNFPELDGIVRRVPAVYRVQNALLPSLALETLRVATGQKTFVVKSVTDGIKSVVLAGVEIPTDDQGRVWVKFRKQDTRRYLSAYDVLNKPQVANLLRNKLVLVGASAAGLLDIRSTPRDRTVPGVEVHAQFLENILFRDYIRRPYYALPIEFFAIVALGLLLIYITPVIGPIPTFLSGLLALGVCGGAVVYLYLKDGLLFDLSYTGLSSFLVFIFSALSNYVREYRSKRMVQDAFGHFVSPEIVDQITRQSKNLLLGGEERELTILFSDIRGFTGISQRLNPDQLTHLMNIYLTEMAGIILKYNGTIDKFIGDAIMAFWNAPLDDPEHASHALAAALEMSASLETLNARLQSTGEAHYRPVLPLRTGIGINSGTCIVGNFGAEQRFDYSALGDHVNIAARLEGLTKTYGVKVLVTEDTASMAKDFAFLKLDAVEIRGRKGTTDLYALAGDIDYKNSAQFTDLRSRHEELLKDYKGAKSEIDADRVAAVASMAPSLLATYFSLMQEGRLPWETASIDGTVGAN